MNVESIIAAIIPIVATFERLGIDYYIGGSVVSSAYSLNWSAALSSAPPNRTRPQARITCPCAQQLTLHHIQMACGLGLGRGKTARFISK